MHICEWFRPFGTVKFSIYMTASNEGAVNLCETEVEGVSKDFVIL